MLAAIQSAMPGLKSWMRSKLSWWVYWVIGILMAWAWPLQGAFAMILEEGAFDPSILLVGGSTFLLTLIFSALLTCRKSTGCLQYF